MEKVAQCINCKSEIIGTYCHSCGQKAVTSRLTWKSLFKDLQQRLFGLDNKFMHTVRDLTIRPDKVIKSILSGIRVQYVGPVGYYFLMLTIYVLLASFLGVDLLDMMSDVNQSLGQQDMTPRQEKFNQEVMPAVFENFRIFSFFMLPFYMVSNWLLYKRSGLNFIEHSVIVLYALGHPFILNILMIAVYWMAGVALNLTIMTIGMLFYGWVCTSYYSGKTFKGFLKGIASWLLGFLLLIVTSMVFTVTYLAMNPHLLKGAE